MKLPSGPIRGFVLLLAAIPLLLPSQESPGPQLNVVINREDEIVLRWSEAGTSYLLEESDDLGPDAAWRSSDAVPRRDAGSVSVTVPAAGADRYFRLRAPTAPTALRLTGVVESSPESGETGVAVTRETILRLSAPLAATTRITIDDFHAEFGGRRILSRPELSTDRKTVTLFHLEPLPAAARVRVVLDGNRIFDDLGNLADFDGDGRPGGSMSLDFETVGITPVPGTAVIGRVFASEPVTGADGKPTSVNRPLGGVIVTVDGAEQTLRAVTDPQGNFKLQPAPAGHFFVHVDGRQAAGSSWPAGAYYPVVGKAWEAVAGREDNRAGGTGEIYLPLIKPNTLQAVSPIRDTAITFPAEVLQANPALAGVSITVPANSLFSDNGTRGGRVGIAPVAPDRLPEQLPPGLNFPLVITVQTDGPGNFDRPVSVRFPNLPDPQTGRALPPGAKTALWSFNHDTGRWEIQGSMTVSSDGKFVDSDPGVGIRQPGWHSSAPATAASLGGPLPLPTSSVVGGPMLCPTTPATPVPPPAPPPPSQWVVTVGTATSAPINPLPQNVVASETIYVGSGYPLTQGTGLHASVCTVTQGPGGPATTTGPASPARSQPPTVNPSPGSVLDIGLKQSPLDQPRQLHDLDGSHYLMVKDGSAFQLAFFNYSRSTADLEVNVVVEGPADPFLDGITDTTHILPPSSSAAHLITTRPFFPRLNPQNVSSRAEVIENDQLYSARIHLEARNRTTGQVVERREIIVVRYVDAMDADPADGILDFPKTSPNVARRRKVDRFEPPLNGVSLELAHPFPFSHQLGGFFQFSGADEGNHAEPLLVRPAVGNPIGTLRVRGTADRTMYFIDPSTLDGALVAEGSRFRSDDILARVRRQLNLSGLAGLGITETTTLTNADIVVRFDNASHARNDTWEYPRVATDRGNAYLKDYDFDWDATFNRSILLDSYGRLNTPRFEYLLSEALNRRFAHPSLSSIESLLIVPQSDQYFDAEPVAGYLAYRIAQGIGFHLGIYESGIESALNRIFYFVAPEILECPHFSEDVMTQRHRIQSVTICAPAPWRVATGTWGPGDIERTHDYFRSIYESLPLLPNFFVGGDPAGLTVGRHARAATSSGADRPPSPVVIDPAHHRTIDRVDFGAIGVDGVGGAAGRIELELRNQGTTPLLVRSIRLQAPAGFSLGDPIPSGTAIAGGTGVRFSVAFDPLVAGVHHGNIVIETDASPEFMVLHVQGTGTRDSGRLQVTIRKNNAGGSALQSAAIRLPDALLLENLGNRPLRIHSAAMTVATSDFSLSVLSTSSGVELAAGQTVPLDLAFHPTRLGLLSGVVEITTDDPDRPVVRIPVCGTGLPAGEPAADWGHDHVLIESGGSASRLESDARGDFFAFLPADQPYTVRVFDPVSGLVWFGAGLSAPAGQPTTFGIPVFRASTADDKDLDGLPDDINLILGPGWRFDFGTATSPVAAGHAGIAPETRYTGAIGHGWLGGAVTAADAGPGGAPALARDWNATPDGVFAIDLPAGTFDVTATFAAASGEIQVLLEGQYRGLASPPTAEIPSQTFRVVVTDGQLNIGFRSTTGATAALAALTIRQVESGVPSNPTPPVTGRILSAIQDRADGTVTRREFDLLPGGPLPSNIVGTGRPFRQWFVETSTYRIGYRDFDASRPGTPLILPDVLFGPSRAPDSDGDGLDDLVEFVAGTDANQRDTDGDGLTDKAELDQGSDPLDPTPRGLGVIGIAPLTGAVDVAAENGIAAVLSQSQGGRLSLFNVFGELPPVLVGEVKLAGFTATRVTLSGTRAVVAEQSFGAEVIDISNPATAVVRHRFEEGVEAVAVAGAVAYLGTTAGEVVAFDVDRGFALSRVAVGGPIQDIAVQGGRVVALSSGRLHVLRVRDGILAAGGSIEIPSDATRVAVDGGIACVSHPAGFNTYAVSDPANPTRIATTTAERANWADVTWNGSGRVLGVAGGPTDANLLVYASSAAAQSAQFISEIRTPDQSRAVALDGGLAHVAGTAGLTTVRYLAPDAAGKPPSITLDASFPLQPGSAEERASHWIGATVADDVQVRHVEFLIDGEVAATDTAAPFEYHFETPSREGRTSFRVQARAIDTGGNSSTTVEYPVTLLPDRTAPTTWLAFPSPETRLQGYLPRLVVALSEPIDPDRLAADALVVHAPGPDGLLGTPDDLPVPLARPIWDPAARTLSVPLAQTPLRNGFYRAVIKPGLSDLAGNGTARENAWTFTIDDSSGPQIVGTSPAANEPVLADLTEITIRFDEPLNKETVTDARFTLRDAGSDGLLETADDRTVAPAKIEYSAGDFTVRLVFAEPLAPQRYLVRVSASVANYNGFPMGRRSTQDQLWRFSVLIRTTVHGLVVRDDGSPASGAVVSVVGMEGGTRTDPQGRFTVAGVVVPPGARLAVSVQSSDDAGNTLLGQASHLTPVHSGRTDAGTLRLRPVCEPRFEPDAFAPTGLTAPVTSFAIFDDGSGPTVYATSGDELRRWRNDVWERVPGDFSSLSATTGGVPVPAELQTLAVHDDGTGPALYVGGRFTSAGRTAVNGLARWNGRTWSAVGPLLTGQRSFGATVPAVVSALTVFNDGSGPALIVGGSFSQAGTIETRDLARWNGREWSSFGSVGPFGGTADRVRLLATLRHGATTELYVAGDFDRIGGVACPGFARWDGRAWSAMDSGTAAPETGLKSGSIQALIVFNDDRGDALHVGGIFESIGGVAARGAARWNGQTWSALGEGLNREGGFVQVRSFATFNDGTGSALYASGDFDRAGSGLVRGIARWNGREWSSVGRSLPDTFVAAGSGYSEAMIGFNAGPASALFVAASDAVVADGDAARSIPGQFAMRWTGTEWLPAGGDLSGTVNALAWFDDGKGAALIAGGNFEYADGVRVRGIARREGRRWVPLGDGFGTQVDCLHAFNGELYAAGQTATADGAGQILVARWNGATWTPIATGDPAEFGRRVVRTLATFNDGSGPTLYAAGSFGTLNGIAAAGVARWNGREWSAVGEPLGDVWSLVVFDDGTGTGPALFAGGQLQGVGGIQSVAKWDGSRWNPLPAPSGASLPGAAFALAVHDDGTGPALHAGGNFDRIYRWSSDGWLAIGSIPSGYQFPSFQSVRCLVSFDDGWGYRLYAAGDFRSGDLNPFAFAARLVGTRWALLGAGFDGPVRAWAVSGPASAPTLHLAGDFSRADGRAATRVARWMPAPAPCASTP